MATRKAKPPRGGPQPPKAPTGQVKTVPISDDAVRRLMLKHGTRQGAAAAAQAAVDASNAAEVDYQNTLATIAGSVGADVPEGHEVDVNFKLKQLQIKPAEPGQGAPSIPPTPTEDADQPEAET